MLVSPAEHNILRDLGRVSPITEKFGADFLITSKSFGLVGVQRKEIKDLVASVRDGRLQREVAQMKALGQGIFLIEGKVQWTTDGSLLSGGIEWTLAQHVGVVLSLNSDGFWTISTSDIVETREWLLKCMKWLGTEVSKHRSIRSRPGPVGKSIWGTNKSRDWAIHLLQSFEGIGYELACRIYDEFGGLPMQWSVDVEELARVKGIGKGRAERLMEALGVVDKGVLELPEELR